MTDYNFDKIINRHHTDCFKWDLCDQRFHGKDLLPLWVADMDFECAPAINESIKKRTEHGLYGYTFQPQKLTDAILKWNKKRHHWEVDSDSIVYSSGVVPSLILAIHAFSNPGDKIIIQSPVYYPFFDIVPKNNRTLIINPLKKQAHHYEMDFDHLRSVIKEAKLFLLCSPHNPVGRVWKKEELLELGKICLENDVLIVSDEIHADIVYSGHKHYPIADLSTDLAQNTITCMAPSKTFNIAGLMLSYVVIENEALRQSFKQKCESLGHLMNNPFALAASYAAYAESEEWVESLLSYLQSNIDFLEKTISNEFPQMRLYRPEGTYLAWLDMNKLGLSDEELNNRLLNNAHLALSDGKTFGKEGAQFKRLNFACPQSILVEALKRFKALTHS